MRRGRRGFTLLEVLVSLAILGLALTAIAGINANSFESSNYARFITAGTLLARSKMIDIEEQLRKDGFGDDDKEFSGDFSDEGFPTMKWNATCRKVEVNVGQLVNGMLGGDVDPEALPAEMEEFIKGMTGKSDSEELAKAVGGGELAKMLGGGGLEMIFKQVGETLANSIREITLEITWGGKKEQESIKFVQYVTTTGRLAIPQFTGNTGLGGRTDANLQTKDGLNDDSKGGGDQGGGIRCVSPGPRDCPAGQTCNISTHLCEKAGK